MLLKIMTIPKIIRSGTAILRLRTFPLLSKAILIAVSFFSSLKFIQYLTTKLPPLLFTVPVSYTHLDVYKRQTLEFAPFINIMSEWYAKDISKKVKTGIKTKGMSGKPIATEAPYGYMKDPDNKDFWIIDEEAAEVVRLIFRLFIGGKNRNQIAVYLKSEQIPTPTFYMKDRGRGTCKNKALNEDNRYKWNKATLTHILTRQEYCGDVVNFKTTKHFRDKRNHYVCPLYTSRCV